MAWSYENIHVKLPIGNRWLTYGTWDATGVIGGEVDTRLTRVDAFFITHTGAAVEVNVATANEAFPLVGGSVTMVTNNGDAGTWLAIGK